MDTILKVLGFLFLGTLALIAVLGLLGKVAVWLLRRRLQRLMGPIEKMKFQDVPVRIHMERVKAASWKDASAVSDLATGVRALGFADVGAFVPREMGFMRMQVLVKPEECTFAVVYEHDRAGAWLDFISSYEDGGTFTASSAVQGANAERRPGKVRIDVPGANPAEIHQRFLAERREEGLATTSARSFAECFEKAYADDMDWRNSRGGPSDDEIQRLAAAAGIQLTEEMRTVIRSRELEKAVKGLNVALRERLRVDPRVSETDRRQADEGRIVFVFDLIPAAELGTFLAKGIPAGGEGPLSTLAGGAVPEDVAALPAREAFARLNEAAPPRHRYRKLAEMTDPLPADAWLAPRRTRKEKRA